MTPSPLAWLRDLDNRLNQKAEDAGLTLFSQKADGWTTEIVAILGQSGASKLRKHYCQFAVSRHGHEVGDTRCKALASIATDADLDDFDKARQLFAEIYGFGDDEAYFDLIPDLIDAWRTLNSEA